MLAAGLLILIGGSGIAAAAGLLGIAIGGGGSVPGVEPLTLLIGAVLGAYGCGLMLAGIALLFFRRWAWWLGIGLIAVGLLALLATILIGRSPDPVLLFGVAVWGAALVVLVLPQTRRAIGR
jgi:asparagine N-glycosylation enzyme membrane subunit Stt3